MRAFDNLVAIGYGFINDTHEGDSVLRQVDLEYRNHTYCQSIYWNGRFQQDTGTQICANAKNKSICIGDSGGPLMTVERGVTYTVGLTSWVINCHNNRLNPVDIHGPSCHSTKSMSLETENFKHLTTDTERNISKPMLISGNDIDQSDDK